MEQYNKEYLEYLKLIYNHVKDSCNFSSKETIVMDDVLVRGLPYSFPADKLNLTTGRVKQIYHKCFRKIIIHIIKQNLQIEELNSIKDKNSRLESENRFLRSMLTEKDRTFFLSRADVYAIKVHDLPLTVRLANCLKAADILTLGDLAQMRRNDFLRFRNFGRKSLTELDAIMEEYKISFVG